MEASRKPIGDLLERVPRQKKVKRSDYQERGQFPIVDQSQAFIAGYTDDETCLYEGELPVVVFGDHTRVLKFVKFPFCVGADGTQLLRPVDGIDVRYLYYALRNIDLTNYGYERHFKYLKEEQIEVPSLPVQHQIAEICSAYDDLVENSLQRIKILEGMAESLYREWFVYFRFPHHEKLRMVDSPLGQIPEGWEVKSIGEVVETLGGSTPSTKIPAFWDEGDVIWFTPSDLTAAGTMFITDSGKMITRLGLEKSSARLFPSYSVMMTSRATIGVVAINTKEACTNQGFITCIPNEWLSTYQLYFWICENKEKIISVASGATYKEINRTEFRELPIILPSSELTRRFTELIGPIGKQIENLQSKNTNLHRTRDLLLPKLISGELDVSELDIAVPAEVA